METRFQPFSMILRLLSEETSITSKLREGIGRWLHILVELAISLKAVLTTTSLP